MAGKTVVDSIRPDFYRLFSSPLTIYDFYLESPYAAPSHRYAAYIRDITFAGNLYTALAIKRSPIKSEEGTIINEIDIGLDNVDLEFRTLVASGAFNKKRCIIKLIFANQLDNANKSVVLFDGYLDAPSGDDHWVSMKVQPLNVLDREYPKRIFQVGCNAVFGDDDCGMDLTDFVFTLTASAACSSTVINFDDSTVDYFVTLPFTSGGTYEPQVDDEIEGDISGATATIVKVSRYYNDWEDGDAIGSFLLKDQVGTFEAETLHVGANADIATINGDSNTLGIDDNYFVPGYIEILDGDLVGEVRPIQFSDNTSVTLRVALSDSLAEGASFKLQKLCAKSLRVCDETFSNRSAFQGFPSVPKTPVL